jgi:hypothetical protein
MRGLIAGKQAQMIATLHSIADQVAAPTLSSIDKLLAMNLCAFNSSKNY